MIEILIFLGVGAAAGCLSGLFGLGGGVIVVPALVFSFDLMHYFPNNVMQVAQGTSLAIMMVTTAASALSHYRRGNLLVPLIRRLMPGIIIGVFFGALAAHFIPSFCLRIIFGCFLLSVSAYMGYISYFRQDVVAEAWMLPSIMSASVVSLFIGFCSGLLGTGAGSLSVPYLSHYRFQMKHIAAAASACSFPIAIIGAMTYLCLGFYRIHAPWTTGYINWTAFLFVAITGLIFAPIGTGLATRLNSLVLKRIFAVILLLLAIEML